MRSGNGDRWWGRAFGLTLTGSVPLESVAPARSGARSDTRLERAQRRAIDAHWRRARPRTLLERRLPDGSVGLSVARNESLAFRVWAPRHGCYQVAPDGRRVMCAPPAGPAWRWERLVLAQVLPLAAVLRGLEVLHASAVAIAGRAVAFLGASGVGKTSLAARLAARGAPLVTDDVLAVTATGTAVHAHRGGSHARIDPAELRRMGPAERRTLGEVRVRSPDKWHVAPALAPATLPLAMTYHVVRSARKGLEIATVRPYDPALLLGSAFLPYLRDPERLRRQLTIGAAIAERVPLYQLRVGTDVSSGSAADAVLDHATAILR